MPATIILLQKQNLKNALTHLFLASLPQKVVHQNVTFHTAVIVTGKVTNVTKIPVGQGVGFDAFLYVQLQTGP